MWFEQEKGAADGTLSAFKDAATWRFMEKETSGGPTSIDGRRTTSNDPELVGTVGARAGNTSA
jgi:hypothetical protein